jgi:hypothetical protein
MFFGISSCMNAAWEDELWFPRTINIVTLSYPGQRNPSKAQLPAKPDSSVSPCEPLGFGPKVNPLQAKSRPQINSAGDAIECKSELFP